MPLKLTIAFLQNCLVAADLKGSRFYLDLFTDRLTKAVSEATLAGAMEQLLRCINASADKLHPPLAAQMMRLAASDDGPRVLRWLRDQTRLAVMLAACKDQAVVDEALASAILPEAGGSGAATARKTFQIGLRATCEAPLAHGADGKAGNATLFRRIQVLAGNGEVLRLPYYAGNALRGQTRDLLADHMLASLGLPADRAKPAVVLWFFYALYSGGALEENSEATKAMRKLLGDHGSIRAEGLRKFRDMLPSLSLLGCALGNRVLPGHCQFADLRPICREWGTGDKPMAELLTWEYLTRREDHEEHEEHHGMIANTEVLKSGVCLEGGIDMDDSMPAVERAALGKGLLLLQARGKLGAENRRGFGKVKIELTGLPDPAPYEAFLAERKTEILDYLGKIGAIGNLS
jgi:hypothetical protein